MNKVGNKNIASRIFGGKRINQAAKFGGKALMAAAALAPIAAFASPAVGAALEAAGVAGGALTGIHKAKQYAKKISMAPAPIVYQRGTSRQL